MPLCGFAGSPHWLHQWMASPDFSFHVCLFCFCFVLLRLFVLVFVFFWFVFCVYSSLFSLSLYLLFHEKLIYIKKKIKKKIKNFYHRYRYSKSKMFSPDTGTLATAIIFTTVRVLSTLYVKISGEA